MDERHARPRSAARPTPAQAAALFETYQARLRGYVAFRVREPADLENLTAEVFRRVVAGPIPADAAAWPAWLFRVAHNIVVNHYRHRRFPDPMGTFVDRPDDAPGLPEQEVRSEDVRFSDAALRSLPGRQRAAIYLRYYEEMDYTDVGGVLGVPASAARSLVLRGLKRVARDRQAQDTG